MARSGDNGAASAYGHTANVIHDTCGNPSDKHKCAIKKTVFPNFATCRRPLGKELINIGYEVICRGTAEEAVRSISCDARVSCSPHQTARMGSRSRGARASRGATADRICVV